MPIFTRSLDSASLDPPSDSEQYLPHPLDHSDFHNEVVTSNQHKESVFDVLLRIQAHSHQRASHCEIDYLRYEAISYPHWANERMAPIWIVNPRIDSIREEYPSDQVKLPVGSLLHLHDSDLAMNSLGFEHHAALGMILEGGWREPGFHIFPFETHLYTITGERPFPIPITKMYIALPEYLVAEEDVKEQLCLSSIGQRLDKEEFGVRPPLRPWIRKRNWRHPAEKKIKEWAAGRNNGFVEEWNKQFMDKMM